VILCLGRFFKIFKPLVFIVFLHSFLSAWSFSFLHSSSPPLPPITLSADRKISIAEKSQPYFFHRLRVFGASAYVLTFQDGIKVFNAGESSDLGDLPINPATGKIRQIEDLWVNEGRVFFVTKSHLYEHQNGKSREMPMLGVRAGSRLSSVAYFNRQYFIGTTFNGVYTSFDGTNWQTLRDTLPKQTYSWNEFFWDEICQFFIFNRELFLLTDRLGAVYRFTDSKWVQVPAEAPIQEVFPFSQGASPFFISGSKVLQMVFDRNYVMKPATPSELGKNIQLSFSEKTWRYDSLCAPRNVYPYRKAPASADAKDRRALFVNLDFITDKSTQAVLEMLKNGQINALVINFKDDTGNLIWNPELPAAKEIGSGMNYWKLYPFLKAVKPYNPYLIARFVCFKDYRLHQYASGKYTIWDTRQNKPWRVNDQEYWVDPYSDFVRHYNVEAAAEVSRRSAEWGIREIQFDYIRQPSDGDVAKAVFRYKKPDWDRYDVLDAFLNEASQKITLPISVDFYGYKGIYRMGNILGQDVEVASQYIDVLCPMFYPSHFGDVYLTNGPGSQAYNIMQFGTQQAKKLVYEGVLVRPYIQAFSWGAKNYGVEYVADQIHGCENSLADGYSFWHPISDYTSFLEWKVLKTQINK
jgi:hypothetical protein